MDTIYQTGSNDCTDLERFKTVRIERIGDFVDLNSWS